MITILLYAGKSWTIYGRHARQLNKFHMSCLCKLLRIKWQDKVPNTEVLTCMGMPSIHTLLSKVQVRWVGHVLCMSDECLPKRLLYGKLFVGKCQVGRPKLQFKDSLKMSLKDLEIPVKLSKFIHCMYIHFAFGLGVLNHSHKYFTFGSHICFYFLYFLHLCL